MFAQPPVSSVIRSSPSTLLPAAARPGKLPSLLAKIINMLLLHACVQQWLAGSLVWANDQAGLLDLA
jgi:hypothetical protein